MYFYLSAYVSLALSALLEVTDEEKIASNKYRHLFHLFFFYLCQPCLEQRIKGSLLQHNLSQAATFLRDTRIHKSERGENIQVKPPNATAKHQVLQL